MLRFIVAAAIVLILSSFALGQSVSSKVQLFGGYSFFHADAGGLNAGNLDPTLEVSPNTLGPTTNYIDGFNVEGQYKVSPALALVADVNGRRGSLLTAAHDSGISGLPNFSGYSFLFGPQISFNRKARPVTPFVHALFGWDDMRIDASTPKGLPTISNTPAETNSAFTIALGGGADYKLTKYFSLRLAQVDYFRTTHNLRTIYGDLFGPGNLQNLALHQVNARISTGVLVRF
jgi:opacity protein-like surface antigen